MKVWMKFFETLGGKLPAILAFAVLVIAVLALIGGGIPSEFRILVYFIVIAAMVIFAAQFLGGTKSTEESSAPQEPSTSSPEQKPQSISTQTISNISGSRSEDKPEDEVKQRNASSRDMQESKNTDIDQSTDRGHKKSDTSGVTSTTRPVPSVESANNTREQLDTAQRNLRDNIEGFVQFTDSSIDFRIAKLKLDQKKDSNDLDWEEIKTLLKNADVNISSGDLASSLNKIKEFREFKQELKAALRLIESLPPNKVAKKKAEILEHMGNALARVDIIVKVCKKHTDEYMGQIDQIIKSISQPSQESNKQNSYQAQKSQSTETVQSQNSTNRSGSSASDKSTHGVPIPSGQPASR